MHKIFVTACVVGVYEVQTNQNISFHTTETLLSGSY